MTKPKTTVKAGDEKAGNDREMHDSRATTGPGAIRTFTCQSQNCGAFTPCILSFDASFTGTTTQMPDGCPFGDRHPEWRGQPRENQFYGEYCFKCQHNKAIDRKVDINCELKISQELLVSCTEYQPRS